MRAPCVNSDAVLRGDDLEVVVEGHRRIAPEAALHDLAFAEADAGVGRPADDLLLEAPAQLEGLAEQEVAGDERDGEAVALERRRAPAPRLAAVDDVVVQQRRRVDQLERDRHVDHVGDVAAAAGLEHQQRDRRADALAAATDQMQRDLREQRLARREQPLHLLLDLRELVGDQLESDGAVRTVRRAALGGIVGTDSLALPS